MTDNPKSLFFDKWPYIAKDGAITNTGLVRLPEIYEGTPIVILPQTNGTTRIFDGMTQIGYVYPNERALAFQVWPWYRKLFGWGPKWKVIKA